MIACVRSVSFASMARGSSVWIRGSMSQKTGVAPWCSTAIAVATKVNAGTMTSPPGRIPAATTAQWSAAVPLLVIRQKRAPQ
jgi:hypothetical protein